MTGSFVYVVRGSHNVVKIGVTTNPSARLASLRTGSPVPINFAFIGATTGPGLDIEAEAHAALARQRLEGEWFDVSPEMASAVVMGAAAKLGYPMQPVDLATSDAILKIAAGAPFPGAPVRSRGWGIVVKPVLWLAFLVLAFVVGSAIINATKSAAAEDRKPFVYDPNAASLGNCMAAVDKAKATGMKWDAPFTIDECAAVFAKKIDENEHDGR